MRALVCVLSLLGLAQPAHADCQLSAGPEKTVARVIDAETLLLDDGSRVRLTGALAPRASESGVAAGHWPAEAAAIAHLEQLSLAKAVRLRFDVTRQDRHGQWLAQVDVATGDGARVWLQAAMLEAGHARVDAVVGQRACLKGLIAAEDKARAVGAGLWTQSAYGVREPMPARDIASYRGTYQVVAGHVHSVETTRDVTRLLLGPDRRRDMSVSIRSNDRELIGSLGGDLKALQNQRIEVRGWIDQRRGAFAGPDVEVTLSGHVRRLDR